MSSKAGWIVAGLVGIGTLRFSLLGCVGDSNTSTPDAGNPDVAVADAGGPDVAQPDASDAAAPACDLKKPFSSPVVLGGAINTAGHDDSFWLLPDQLTVFTSSERFIDGSVGDFDILTGTRASANDSFTTLSVVGALSSALPDRGPVVTGDGTTLYFTRGYYPYKIYVATRASALVPFGTAQLADAPLNGTTNDQVGWISPDGRTIYISSDRAGSASSDVYVATRNGAGFNTPTLVPSLNSAALEVPPILTADELQIFIGSSRTGGMGDYDIYYASRPDKSAGFSTPIPLTELNTSLGDFPDWVSPDGCTLYFASNNREGGVGGWDVYVSSRGK